MTALWPWCFERNEQKFSKITVFGASFKHDLVFISRDWGSRKWSLFSVFGPVSNTTQGLENGHFSLFLDQFQTRLSLHISGLEGLEMGTFLVWGASRPCSAECCLVIPNSWGFFSSKNTPQPFNILKKQSNNHRKTLHDNTRTGVEQVFGIVDFSSLSAFISEMVF